MAMLGETDEGVQAHFDGDLGPATAGGLPWYAPGLSAGATAAHVRTLISVLLAALLGDAAKTADTAALVATIEAAVAPDGLYECTTLHGCFFFCFAFAFSLLVFFFVCVLGL
jgi:hypothetical protein